MSTFQVPQFIEEQPKIVGFLTLPQFLYLVGAGGLSFAAFYIFNFFLWLLITAAAAALAVALAFVKVNGQPFIRVLISGLGFLLKPRTYTWQRALPEEEIEVGALERLTELRKKMSLEDRLKSVALAVTTGKFFSGAKGSGEGEGKDRYQTVTYLTGEKKVAKRVDYR